MSFFDSTPEGEGPPRLRPPERLYAPSGPVWMNNPEQYFLPALLPWVIELGRAAEAVLALRGITVWPDSCNLDIAVFSQRPIRLLPGGSPIGYGPDESPARGGVRLGVLFADGRRATTGDRSRWFPPQPGLDPADGPVLWHGGGSGSQFHLQSSVRLWPLTPDGPLTLVVDWLDQGIAETRTELNGSAIRAAAAGALEIWSDLPPQPPGGGPRSA